jgi:hypothetical protein
MAIDYLTLSQMVDQVGRFIGDTTSRRDTMITERLNSDYADLAARYRWPELLRGFENAYPVVSGEAFLYLPKNLSELYFIIPGSPVAETPHQTIEKFFQRQLETFNSVGRLLTWSDAGEFGRRAEFPATATKLTLQNVGASIATQQTVLVQGLVAVGSTSERVELLEEVSLTGSTAVDTVKTYSDLIQVTATGDQTGYISVVSQTDPTLLFATIEPGEVTARYQRIRLGYVPQNSDTVTIYFKKQVKKLTEDTQVPEIPIARVLVELSISAMFAQERKWQGAATYHQQIAERYLEQIWAKKITQPGKIQQAVPLGTMGSNRRSNTIVVTNG